MKFISTNPFTQDAAGEYPHHNDSALSGIINEAHEAYSNWRRVKLSDRAILLRKVAERLETTKLEHGQLITREMGKRLSESMAEISKCAGLCRYYADEAPKLLARESRPVDEGSAFISFRPMGVVLGVMPWNFPFWQVFRFAVPAMMAGNAILLKHASNVTGCALAMERIFEEAGIPKGVFKSLVVPSNKVSQVIQRREIAAVTCTGSARAGKSVAKAAGENLKKSVLELGGSDPYIVLEDAPIAETVALCEESRFLNCGQSCISAKRFIVMHSVLKDFLECLVERIRNRSMGDPMLDTTTLAPMARQDLVESLHAQVTGSIHAGARPLLGASLPDHRGSFYSATLLSHVEPGMPAFEEELFGPVASVMAAKTEKEAIALANQSRFGLGAAVFTSDTSRGERIAEEELEAGCCSVNDFVRSNPKLPFGGIKESGYGRELADFGLKEFVNIKSVCVADGAGIHQMDV